MNILPWSQVVQREDYQALSIDERERVREGYWITISQEIPEEDLAKARAVFDNETREESAGVSEWGAAWSTGWKRLQQMGGAGLEMLGRNLEDAAKKRWTPEGQAFEESFEDTALGRFKRYLSPRPRTVAPESIKQQWTEVGKGIKEKAQRHLESGMPKPPAFVKNGDWWENLKDPETFNAQLAWMLGSNVQPTIAIGASSLLAGMAAGPVGAGATATAGSYLLESGSSYDELLNMGVPEEDARSTAATVGAINAALEVAPLGRLATKIPMIRKKIGLAAKEQLAGDKRLRRILKETLKQGAFEGSTEALQEVVQNAGKKVYDENQDYLQGVSESAFVGSILGGLFGGTVAIPGKSTPPRPITEEMPGAQTPHPDPAQAPAIEGEIQVSRAARLQELQKAGLEPELSAELEGMIRRVSASDPNVPTSSETAARSNTLRAESAAQTAELDAMLNAPEPISQQDVTADIPYVEVTPESPVMPTPQALPAPPDLGAQQITGKAPDLARPQEALRDDISAEPVLSPSEKEIARTGLTGPAGDTIPTEVLGKEPDIEPDISSAVDMAATDAAPSDATEAQIEAGNYKKGHIKLNGLDISIENQAGTKRRPEWPSMKAHYGYIRRTEAQDGDQLDVFVKPGLKPEQPGDRVYIVDQVKQDGSFDEHKVMVGYGSKSAAKRAYMGSYTPGWRGMGAITSMPIDEFKVWLKLGDLSQPYSPDIRGEGPKFSRQQPEIAEPVEKQDVIKPPPMVKVSTQSIDFKGKKEVQPYDIGVPEQVDAELPGVIEMAQGPARGLRRETVRSLGDVGTRIRLRDGGQQVYTISEINDIGEVKVKGVTGSEFGKFMSPERFESLGKKQGIPLNVIQMPKTQYEIEETGETVEIQQTAEAALSKNDEVLTGLYALRECIRR